MRYSERFRATMVKKMLRPNGKSASELARQVGVAQPTLSRWVREARMVGGMKKLKTRNGTKKARTAVEKVRLVAEASRLSDQELGEFLRREGLHEVQLKEWREAMEGALVGDKKRRGRKTSQDQKRIKELERELRRKERALAEAAALLVLKKKADAIWGDEDDDTTRGNDS